MLTDNFFSYTARDGANDLLAPGVAFTTAGTVSDNATTTPFSSVTLRISAKTSHGDGGDTQVVRARLAPLCGKGRAA
jgi:hypothetical protein